MAWDWCLSLAVSHGEPGWGKAKALFKNFLFVNFLLILKHHEQLHV